MHPRIVLSLLLAALANGCGRDHDHGATDAAADHTHTVTDVVADQPALDAASDASGDAATAPLHNDCTASDY